MSTLRVAFKEWAVICRALAEGRQTLILRKGGVAEGPGGFRVEHDRFWLYPTWAHQQESGIVAEARPLLDAVRGDRPPEGVVRLTHFALVPCVYHVTNLDEAEQLADLHVWSAETVRARFAYRRPGLFVLPVRVYRGGPVALTETAEYAGCKSWVMLDRELPTDGATPVMSEEAFDRVVNALDRLLGPTALA